MQRVSFFSEEKINDLICIIESLIKEIKEVGNVGTVTDKNGRVRCPGSDLRFTKDSLVSGRDEVVPFLLKVLENKNKSISLKGEIADILGKIGKSSPVPQLITVWEETLCQIEDNTKQIEEEEIRNSLSTIMDASLSVSQYLSIGKLTVSDKTKETLAKLKELYQANKSIRTALISILDTAPSQVMLLLDILQDRDKLFSFRFNVLAVITKVATKGDIAILEEIQRKIADPQLSDAIGITIKTLKDRTYGIKDKFKESFLSKLYFWKK